MKDKFSFKLNSPEGPMMYYRYERFNTLTKESSVDSKNNYGDAWIEALVENGMAPIMCNYGTTGVADMVAHKCLFTNAVFSTYD
jgi:hypothetical protein